MDEFKQEVFVYTEDADEDNKYNIVVDSLSDIDYQEDEKVVAFYRLVKVVKVTRQTVYKTKEFK